MLKTIFVTFDNSSKEYAYLCTEKDVTEGNFAVVYGVSNTVCLTEIVRVENGTNTRATKFALAIIDKDKHDAKGKLLQRYKSKLSEIESAIEEAKREKAIEDALEGNEKGQQLLKELKEIREQLGVG